MKFFNKNNKDIYKRTRLQIDIIAGLLLICINFFFFYLVYHLSLNDIRTFTGGQFADDVDEELLFLSIRHALQLKFLLYGGIAVLLTFVILDYFIKKLLDPIEYLNKKHKDFSDDLSHEIRTPIAVIQTYLELVRVEENTSKSEMYIGTIFNELKKINLLVEDLLFESRIKYGKKSNEKIAIDSVKEIITQSLHDVDFLRNKNTKILFDYDPEFISNKKYIVCRKLDFERVMVNLISNAFKFTPEGEVWVKLQIEPERDSLTINVIDTGVGIDSTRVSKVFERYVSDYGNGLGLSIVKDIIDKYNWKIVIDTDRDKGTAITVSNIRVFGQL